MKIRSVWMYFLSCLFAVAALTACAEDPQKKTDENPPPKTEAKKSMIRVLHGSYDAPAVDILVDGKVAFKALGYGQSSGYAEVEAGERALKVTQAGQSDPALIDTKQKLEDGKNYTIVAYETASNIKALVLSDDIKESADNAKIRIVHAADAPAVDIKAGKADSEPVFANLAKGNGTAYKELPEGEYSFVITAAGGKDAVVTFMPVKLEKGKVYTVVARGTLDSKDKFDFGVRVFVDNSDNQGKLSVDLSPKKLDPPTPTEQANVRVMHMSYDGPGVDIAVDGKVAIQNLEYGKSSGYAKLDAGERALKVTPAGKTSPVVIDAKQKIEGKKSYTIIAYEALSAIKAMVLSDAREPNADKAKIRVVHAADAPAVDIKAGKADSEPVFGNLAKGNGTAYKELPEGEYSFVITAAGSKDAVVTFKPVKLEKGKVYTVVARGTLDSKDKFDFGVRVFIDNDEGKASLDLEAAATKSKVLVVHASPDAPGVDLLVDGKIAGTNLEYPKNTGYLEIPSGDRSIAVNPTGTQKSVIEAKLPFEASKAYSIFAVNVVAKIEPLRLEDNLAPPAKGKAHVRFVHLSPDAPAVDVALKGGAVVFGNKAFKQFTAFTPVDAKTYDFEVRLAGKSTVALPLNGIKLEEGKIYTVFARGLLSQKGAKGLGAQIIVHNP